MAGELCRKAGSSGALCFKYGGSALVFKSSPAGDILVVATSSRSQVGPINTCGNVHDVRVTVAGSSGIGSASATVQAATQTLSGSTESVGCDYPGENPPVTLRIVAVQSSTGRSYSTTKAIANVATGSFTVSISVNANKQLTGVA